MKRIYINILTVFVMLEICLGVLTAWIYHSNRTFTETFYSLYSSKIETPVRAVLISDLHQAAFGEDNEELISRIGELRPDMILMAGDIVNKEQTDIDYAVRLCRRLSAVAPVYYGLGNHENEAVYGNDLNVEFLEEKRGLLGENPENFSAIEQGELLKRLEEAGVTVLQNEAVLADIQGNSIQIGGISTNLSSFWPYSGAFISRFAESEPQSFKILISHRPDPVMEYIAGYAIELAVSGHNHGGVIRIPGVGGLLSADEGLFPDYDSGRFESGPMTLLISRGLGGHGVIPRVFNPPELVIIDILS
ncbi:MAG: hypothetical protein HFG26_03660 [Provencibacterium sp.]|jgi:predicted MPP superfamily phosphohydrolase|nr:hypothetical protein [Provencibacterium sp.]